ncbi:MAG: hypothetical protein IH623_31190 [Verrucomicrobia bacterium]|nr:hypothetical protein [Verrucomicrobiota bacterium]
MQPAQTPSRIPDESKLADLFREQLENSNMLLHNIKQNLPKLEELLAHVEGHWGMEDGIYRFYHQSFKVYHLQGLTEGMCKALQELFPGRPMNGWFTEIVAQGTGKDFEMSHNKEWLRHTRPIVEAFFHAHYFLKMAVKYGKELASAPDRMPSGWAVVLYLFDLR